MPDFDLPTPRDLDDHPELAALAVLDAALRASVFALIAAQPLMRDPDHPSAASPPDSYWVATVVVTFAHQLEDALAGYRRVLGRDRRDDTDDDFPF